MFWEKKRAREIEINYELPRNAVLEELPGEVQRKPGEFSRRNGVSGSIKES